MEIAMLRENLHSLIDNSSAERLEEIYHLLNDEEYPDSFKTYLDEEFFSYQKEEEVLSKEDINKMVEQLPHGKNA